ncbi:MAG: ClbS/DfsB family four-helix bundle protein [Dehalococcoidia bacterium]
MNSEPAPAEEPLKPQDKDLLLERIDQSWRDLQETLGRLREDQVTRPGSDGWSIKDHLAHLDAWERSILSLLQGRPPYEGLGVDEAVYRDDLEDRINEAIYAQNRNRGLPDVLAGFRKTHADVETLLERLTPEDLGRPYSFYLPDEHPNDGGVVQQPALNWIVGNTYEHFREHRTWIEAFVAPQP